MKVDLLALLKEQSAYIAEYEKALKRYYDPMDQYTWGNLNDDFPTIKWTKSDVRRTRILLNKLLIRKGY